MSSHKGGTRGSQRPHGKNEAELGSNPAPLQGEVVCYQKVTGSLPTGLPHAPSPRAGTRTA